MSQLSQLLIIGLLVILAVAKSTLQGRVCRGYVRNTQDSVLYNSMFFFVSGLVILLVFPQSGLNREILLFGFFAALCTFAFQVLYSLAMAKGPVSLSVLIMNFNVLPMTAFSVFYSHENVYYTQLLGVAMLVISMLLSVDRSGDEKKGSVKWLFLILAANLTATVSACLQRVFGQTIGGSVPGASNTFLVVLYAAGTVFALLYSLLRRVTGPKEKPTYRKAWQVPLYASAVGIIIGVYMRFYMVAMASIDGLLFYPTTTGLTSLIMSIVGIFAFRDRLSKKQLIGTACGIACIVLMNLKVGTYFTVG